MHNTQVFCALFVICLVSFGCIDPCYAVPGDIPVMKTVLEKLVPYLGFAFTAGGVYYSGLNGKQVVTGEYRAAPRLLVSVGAAGLGLAGIFGTDALTITLP